MRRSLLAYVPITVFVGTLAVAVFAPPEARWPIIDPTILGLKVLALYGCLVAALSFRPSTRLFRGWLMFAGAYGLLVLRDAVLHRSLLVDIETPSARWIELGMVTVANLLLAAGAWTLANTWSGSGLSLPGTRRTRTALQAITVGVAVVITLPTLWLEIGTLATHFGPKPLTGLANALGDITAMSMIAPVLLTGLALGDAPVGKVWALLTWSLAGWLGYDATSSISGQVAVYGEEMRMLSEAFRAMAVVACAVAGIAQASVSPGEPS